ncbi:MAG: DNA polymerase III subunit delta [Ruminococcus sp.]|jgi:DNA polymerase-3 subunit delta|nr:DNA polymerase III subunit delta [Ruminococcus sp.]
MANLDLRSLRASLKNGIDRVYYFYGKNVTDMEKAVRFIRAHAVKKQDELYNLREFSGKNFKAEEFAAACDCLPVFAETTCVIVNDLNAESLNAAALSTVIETVEKLAATNCVIFYNSGIDITDGKRYPTSKNKKLIDIVSKNGTVCEFPQKTAGILAQDIMKYVSALGGDIKKDAALFLANRVGGDSMIAERECEKLVAYKKEEITVHDIKNLTPQELSSNIYDLARAVSAFDRARAMDIFDELIKQRTEPMTILYSLSGSFMDLYRAKSAAISGRSPETVRENFAYPKNVGFRVDNAFRDSTRASLSHLRECVKILSETDIKMKSGGGDSVILLETALIKMLFSNS